jgi:hypothetical protein
MFVIRMQILAVSIDGKSRALQEYCEIALSRMKSPSKTAIV